MLDSAKTGNGEPSVEREHSGVRITQVHNLDDNIPFRTELLTPVLIRSLVPVVNQPRVTNEVCFKCQRQPSASANLR